MGLVSRDPKVHLALSSIPSWWSRQRWYARPKDAFTEAQDIFQAIFHLIMQTGECDFVWAVTAELSSPCISRCECSIWIHILSKMVYSTPTKLQNKCQWPNCKLPYLAQTRKSGRKHWQARQRLPTILTLFVKQDNPAPADQQQINPIHTSRSPFPPYTLIKTISLSYMSEENPASLHEWGWMNIPRSNNRDNPAPVQNRRQSCPYAWKESCPRSSLTTAILPTQNDDHAPRHGQHNPVPTRYAVHVIS